VRNVAAHAQAQHVVGRLRVEGAGVVFELRDDGCGFSDERLHERQEEGHAGLRLLQAMAADEGATLTVESVPGQGTCLTVAVSAAAP
jgi:two-component system nitrate/nitrite sensor histidine kinase NarX